MYSKLLLNKKKIMFILAIGAGALLCSPSVHALPQQVGYITSGVNINSDGETMNITASANPNNVIYWSSFNIGEGETVKYDQKNYLNLIHDSNHSKIDGNITGGGNIYLINPNGFLFGDNSSINVGNLYISTRALEDVNASDFETKGINPLSIPVTNLVGDIVNLGKIRANQVVLEGNNVTLKNAIDIMNQSDDARNDTVTINAVNSIEIGNADNVDNIWTHNIGITDFKLISTFDELKNMQSGMNYMLVYDIDAGNTLWNGLRQYNGNFNGLNHKISNLMVAVDNNTTNSHSSHISIFGDLHGVVKNVSIVNSKVYGVEDVGSLVGYMYKDAVIDNCHIVGGEVHGTEFVGGIAGTAHGGSITNSTNSSKVYGWSYVGGIVGITDTNDFALKNCHNTGDVQCYFDVGFTGEPGTGHYRDKNRYYNSFTGGLIGCAHHSFFGTDCIIENSSNSGYVKGTTNVGGLVGIYGGKSSITDCINKGTVKGSENIGGLVGNYSPETNDSTIKNCINKGNVIVTGTDSPLTAGELVGGYWNGKISDNYSEGIVKYGATYDNDSEEGLATTNELVGDTYFDKDEIRQLNQKPNTDTQTGTDIQIDPSGKRSKIDNAIYDGLMAADQLKTLISNDFQNFSKGSSLVGETIQVTKDDEEAVSHHLVLED